MMLVGRLRGLTERTLSDKVPELLQLLLLWDSRYSTMAAYSKGMRSVCLARRCCTTRTCSCSTSRFPDWT
jgi:ABC-type multidrug transport system ATPase subunit